MIKRIGFSYGNLGGVGQMVLYPLCRSSVETALMNSVIVQGIPFRTFRKVGIQCHYVEEDFFRYRKRKNGKLEREIMGGLACRLLALFTPRRHQAIAEEVFLTLFASPRNCRRWVTRQRRNGAKLVCHRWYELESGLGDILEINECLDVTPDELLELIARREALGISTPICIDPWHAREKPFQGWTNPEFLQKIAPHVVLFHLQFSRVDHGVEYHQFINGEPTKATDLIHFLIAAGAPAEDMIIELSCWNYFGALKAMSAKRVLQATLQALRRAHQEFGVPMPS